MLIVLAALDYFVDALHLYLYYLPFIAALLLAVYFAHKKRDASISWLHILGSAVFTVYVTVVLTITGTLTLFDILLRGITVGSVALAPFGGVNAFDFIMNVVLFMPLGFLLPVLFKGKGRLRAAALHGFLFSLAIETSQLFNLRATDVDDLIANTLGTVAGFALYKLLLGRRNCAPLQLSADTFYARHEPSILIAAVFLLRFLLAPLIYRTLGAA